MRWKEQPRRKHENRSDFVTNSSSGCVAELVIENPVLLEILQRYKDLGTFGNQATKFGIGLYISDDDYYHGFSPQSGYEEEIPIPAFSYYESPGFDGWNAIWECPKSLKELLEIIIGILQFFSDRNFEQGLLIKLINELHRNEQEINNNYIKVSCIFRDGNEEGLLETGDPYITEFAYDQVSGEQITITPFSGNEDGEVERSSENIEDQ